MTHVLATWRARTPLRITLVAALVVLLAGALLVSGLAATATMRGYLVDRVDAQLSAAGHQLGERGVDGVAGTEGAGPERLPGPDGDDLGDEGPEHGPLPSAFVVQVVDGSGTVVYGPTSNLVDSGQPLPDLPAEVPATGDGGDPFTVDAVSGGDQWRVVAEPVTLSNGSSGTLMVAQSLREVQNTLDRMVLLLLVIGLLTVLVLAGVGYLVVRASLRPLVEVERTAAAIASGDLSSRVPEGDPRTEVGQLSAALNGMLAQIETAFAEREASEEDARRSEQRMRRFVADASQELRTPLTSIRGFAELFRQGAATEPAEVRRAFRRIEDEAAHMGLLVEDLLMLARLDQQRPLDRSPVDLLPLATDAVEDARAVQPERPVRLELGNIDPPPVVTGDEARLRQVLRNLVGNALQHTPVDTPVVVRVSTCAANGAAPGRVLLEVADEGPGMEAEDAARVFERFYRADPSRSRSDGGTGLGLAIAGSLAAVHGGTITLDTAPGEGARFRVELPLAAAEAQ